MSDDIREKYGMGWPEDMPDALIDLKVWKHWREPAYRACTEKEPWNCFWRAIYSLIPRKEFVRHEWAEQHVYDWTTEDFIITWGAASSGKSNDFGLLALVDWMVDPNETVTILASTSLQMLKLRSYESVLRYFQLIKRYATLYSMPGKLRKTDSAIILDEDDDMGATTDKASIRGVAVAEGTDEEARSKLAGAHLPYVRLILDELAQMRPAAMKVRTNLSIGTINFKLAGLCNPDSLTDLAAQYSIPLLTGGFAALDPETSHEWRSRYGKVRRHDGLRCPAIIEKDGDKKYPFLLTKSRLDQILFEAGGNEDDPEVWTMVRGFPPAQGKRQTLITMSEVLRSGATEDVTWGNAPAVTVIGCDPAFSGKGNKAVMQALTVGVDVNNQVKVHCHDPKYIRIEASSKTPVTEQVGTALKEYADELHVPANLVGVDDSATQSLADHMQTQHFMQVQRFVSNAKPSEMPMFAGGKTRAKDKYFNQSTELWSAAAEFIKKGQMRNFPLVAANQLASRPMEPNKKPDRLLSKKTSTRAGADTVSGDSPDEMDAMAIAVGILRFYLSMLAGSDRVPSRYLGNQSPYQRISGLRQLARKHDLDARAYGQEAVT